MKTFFSLSLIILVSPYLSCQLKSDSPSSSDNSGSIVQQNSDDAPEDRSNKEIHDTPLTQSKLTQAEVKHIENALNDKLGFRGQRDPNEIKKIALEYGVNALALFSKALKNSDDQKVKRRALIGLSYIGDTESRRVLQDYYKSSRDLNARAQICKAMAFGVTKEEFNFLIESIKIRETSREEASVIEAAISSLGVLRVTESIEYLKQFSNTNVVDHKSARARIALRNIKGESGIVPDFPDATEKEKVILAGLKYGNEQVEMFNWPIYDGEKKYLKKEKIRKERKKKTKREINAVKLFLEEESKRIWELNGLEWSIYKADRKLKVESEITFDVWFSSNGERAILILGLQFGPLAGSGWEYVLKKEKNEWQVIDAEMTWIS